MTLTREQPALVAPSPVCEPLSALGPVLIRVPALSPAQCKAGARGVAKPKTGTGKRRLRREVRLAGTAMLMATPLAWAMVTQLGGAPESDTQGVPARLIGVEGVGPSFASFEPAGSPLSAAPAVPASQAHPALGRPAGAPVVLPGYVLPAVVPEEPAHAGS